MALLLRESTTALGPLPEPLLDQDPSSPLLPNGLGRRHGFSSHWKYMLSKCRIPSRVLRCFKSLWSTSSAFIPLSCVRPHSAFLALRLLQVRCWFCGPHSWRSDPRLVLWMEVFRERVGNVKAKAVVRGTPDILYSQWTPRHTLYNVFSISSGSSLAVGKGSKHTSWGKRRDLASQGFNAWHAGYVVLLKFRLNF